MEYNLDAPELRFRIIIEGEGQAPIYFAMRPYGNAQLIAALKKGTAETSIKNGKMQLLNGSLSGFEEIFDSTFVRLENVELSDGSSPTVEQQLQWLRANPAIKRRVVNDGFTAVQKGHWDEADDETAVREVPMVLSLDAAEEVSLKQRFALCDANRTVHQVKITHFFRTPSPSEHEGFRGCTRKEINIRARTTVTRIDYRRIESLYDAMIVRVEGMVLGVNKCSAENREAWIPKIPFWHKRCAVDDLFAEETAKNASSRRG